MRQNPPNTAFRRFYERGDLPVAVEHRGMKNVICWKVSGTPRCGSVEAETVGKVRSSWSTGEENVISWRAKLLLFAMVVC